MRSNKCNPMYKYRHWKHENGYDQFELCGHSYWGLDPEDDELYPCCKQFKKDFKGVYCCIGCEKFQYWRNLLGIK